ncbi:hypothetical protein CDL15_Pgr012604 [Punica granatum]|uniref:Uncharacterized protein n=1 Tax=Punica granatum TaxID=22663 RepID=A0A218XY40_PUNGR|nr:hypothetical protein CDL15_Pgr012604 [Punica granatum]
MSCPWADLKHQMVMGKGEKEFLEPTNFTDGTMFMTCYFPKKVTITPPPYEECYAWINNV